jgi:hypothetical protein
MVFPLNFVGNFRPLAQDKYKESDCEHQKWYRGSHKVGLNMDFLMDLK